ncbi:MAG: hypothetical protein ACJ8CR_24665 [Roseiflexaceae bacterium]
MCFQVFLGADVACPEIPQRDCPDDKAVDLYVFSCEGVGGLTKPYQYHPGILSCGCGFSYDIPAADLGDWTLNNHIQLGNYVADCLGNTEPIELFSCWVGAESGRAHKHRDITLAELCDPQFYFEDLQLTRVYKDEASLNAARRVAENME